MKRHIIIIGAAALFLASCASTFELRYPPQKWIRDKDDAPISMPQLKKKQKHQEAKYDRVTAQIEQLLEFTEELADRPSEAALGGVQEALNVNNFDEAPDSTWFTNRIGRSGGITGLLSEYLENGPDKNGGWNVIAVKLNRRPIEMVIKDRNGRDYLLRIADSKEDEIKNGIETTASLILKAAGYNVSENYVVELNPSALVIDKHSWKTLSSGEEEKLTKGDLKDVFQKPRYHALAIRLDNGIPLDSPDFSGKREGDPNDRIPHEHRRELRGYRIFCALLNNMEVRKENLLDFFLETGGDKGYIRHYLVNYYRPLGNADFEKEAEMPKRRQHTVDALFSFGFYNPYWTGTKEPVKKTAGTPYSAADFQPAKWRPNRLNPAFRYLTDRDTFWAAKIIAAFSDDIIREIAGQAKFQDEETEKNVVNTLIARRDKISAYWLTKLNPLDDFTLSGTALKFTDLAVKYGLAGRTDSRYRYRVQTLKGDLILTQWKETETAGITVPDEAVGMMQKNRIYAVRIQTKHEGGRWWGKSVDVLIKKDDGLKMLGLNRRYR